MGMEMNKYHSRQYPRMLSQNPVNLDRHCERSEAIHRRKKDGLLRRVAPRNDDFSTLTPPSRLRRQRA